MIMSRVTQDPSSEIVVGPDRHLGPIERGALDGSTGSSGSGSCGGGDGGGGGGSSEGVVVGVAPVRGRVFLFPHVTPHSGAACIDVPKVMLRAEVAIL